MGQRKIFVSKAGIELAAMASNDSELFLEIKDGDTRLSLFLNVEDTADLIRELQKIKKQISE